MRSATPPSLRPPAPSSRCWFQEHIPDIPGFRIESVYKPAQEVGGNFSQIIPLPDGGLLAAIGNVSGKGMPAAMTVSLLIGTLRTLAHYTQSPGNSSPP